MLQSFVGGLNTSSPIEMIAENELAEVVNMQIDNSGLLRTVRGTRDIVTASTKRFKAAAFDSINNILILFCTDNSVYALLDGTLKNIGSLSGTEEPITVSWEDGLLIASGGYLQYAKYVAASKKGKETIDVAYKLQTITSSKPRSNGVFVRSGRVFVFDDEDNLFFSAVGDEETWTEDSNDPSSAIFAQIGYKVGGRIIGLVNFQSYCLIIKDNGKVYRLENEYPDWVIKEVTSNGMCMGKTAYASIGSSVFLLGEKVLQAISPTDDYGNMPMNQIGKQVQNQIDSLPPWTKMRYINELNQLWFVTKSQWVLVFDATTQTFFQRYFNSDVVDVVGNIIVKRNKVCVLSDEDDMTDNGSPLEYRVKFKTEMALNDILVKHIDLSINPLVSFYNDAGAVLNVGRINVPFPQRKSITEGRRQRTVGVTNTAKEYEQSWTNNKSDVFLNYENVSVGKSILYKKRQVCRCDRVDVSLSGSGFPFILNFISYNKVEV